MSSTKVDVHVVMDEELYRALREQAEREDRSAASFVRSAVRRRLEEDR